MIPRKPIFDEFSKGIVTRLSNGLYVKEIEAQMNTTTGYINAALKRMKKHFKAKNTLELIVILIRKGEIK